MGYFYRLAINWYELLLTAAINEYMKIIDYHSGHITAKFNRWLRKPER